jgi:hypothetical protein
MLQPSSSISSSEHRRRRRLRAVVETCLWTLAALAILDVAVQRAFPMPADANRLPGKLAQYFDYGRSIQGKLARLVGPTDARSAPIVVSGWIDRECRHVPAPVLPGRIGVTVYGMSFSEHIARQLEQLDPTLAISNYGGPAAPANHSYACFQSVNATGSDPNRIQIIGVLASSVARLLTLGGLTTSFEAPEPFTYPRYRLMAGRLVAEQPLVRSSQDLREPVTMAAYRTQLAADDAFFDPWQMSQSWADHSVVLCMLRRGYAQAELALRTRRLVNNGKDFVDSPDVGPTLSAILLQFASTARAQGKLPIVILFQDRGTGTDSLYRLVGPALEEGGVPFVSSHGIAPVNDPRNFIPDGHVTPAVDRLIAQQTLEAIRRYGKSAAAPRAAAVQVGR